ncbi:MAG: hypothetical protein K8J31_08600 [Anaerolineae bacterium]|nr:hypothetical protein [Anaerolineae bacterium]
MSDLILRDDLAARIREIARRENRPVDSVVEALLTRYTLEAAASPENEVDLETRLYELRRGLYRMAREYWQQVGDSERQTLSDTDLDEQFWLIDHEGIPRLKSDQGHLNLPPDPLEAIMGVFDDDVTDMSTSVRQTMAEIWRQKNERPD